MTIRVIKYILGVKKGITMFNRSKKNLNINREWKEKNKQYLKELQNFLDKADNIFDKELKQKIIGQMFLCDEILTKLAEDKFKEFYKLGYKDAKNE